MKRIRVNLTEAEYRSAKAEAERLGISLSELLRRALRDLLPNDRKHPWMRFAGMIESGRRDSSRTIEDVVYGRED